MSRTKPLLLFLFALFAIGVRANGDGVVLESSDIDFGDVKTTDSSEKTVRITNDGESPVKILRASSTCGCTEAAVQPTTLKKGEGIDLKVRLHLNDYTSDKVYSRVTVETDEAGNSSSQFTVQANVLPEYAAVPQLVDFGRVKRDAGPIIDLQLCHRYGPTLKILRVETPDSLQVDSKRAGDDANASADDYALTVQLLPREDSGPFNKRIAIVTDSKRLPRIEIPVHADLVGVECSIQPKVLVFGPVQAGGELGSLVVEGVNSLRIVTVTAQDKDILTSVEELVPDKKYRIVLKASTAASAGRKAGRIQLRVQEGTLIEGREVAYYGNIGNP